MLNQRNSNPQLKHISEMNITSLADVAINLMIIFLIAGISVALSRTGIPVNVPRSSTAVLQRSEGVSITVDIKGDIYIEEKLIKINDFNLELMQALSRKATGQVYLIADEKVDYGIVINVISKTREAGIENIGLVANPQVLKRIKNIKP